MSPEAKRKHSKPLFPNATKYKMYYIEVKGEIDLKAKEPFLEVIDASGYDVVSIYRRNLFEGFLFLVYTNTSLVLANMCF